MDPDTAEPVDKKMRPTEENDNEEAERNSKDSKRDNDLNDTASVDSDADKASIINGDVIEDSFMFPPDEDIGGMLDEVDLNGPFPTVTDRYFTPYYKVDVKEPGDDMCVWVHTNRICMISLAPSHVILRNGGAITKVDYKVSDKLDRASNTVSGKGKHGAQLLQENSNICSISTSDGQTRMIKCCMFGKLTEVNETLSENPELLREPPHRGGYLAIVLPKLKLLDKTKATLLTEEQYNSVISERTRLAR